jgi:O-antigen/teichoic acid export membrane protein
MDNNQTSTGNDSESSARQLSRKTVRAAIWNYLSFGLGKLSVMVTITILARLLGPNEFGVVGYANLAIAYLTVLQDLGLSNALIQRRTDIEEASDSVFTSNLLVGMALTLFVYFTAPFVALFFHEPRVELLLQVLGVSFTIEALGSAHLALLKRELNFRRKMIPDLGRALVKGVVSIGLALLGYGVWSLVIGQLAGVAASVALAWMSYPWRPRLHINTAIIRSMFSFSVPLIAVDILAAIGYNLDYTLVGRMLGDTALGLYTMAYKIPELAISSICVMLAQVLFPAYSSVQHDMRLLTRGFLATIRYLQVVITPIALTIIILADPLVRGLLGSAWIEAIPLFQLIAVACLMRSIGTNVGDVYKAVGRPSILWKIGIVTIAVLAACLVIGVRYGLTGIAIAHVVAALQQMSLRLYIATRVLDVTLRDIWLEIRPSVNAGVALCLAALPVYVLTEDLNPFVRLLLVGAAAGSAYLGTLWLLERNTLIKMLEMAGINRPMRAARE